MLTFHNLVQSLDSLICSHLRNQYSQWFLPFLDFDEATILIFPINGYHIITWKNFVWVLFEKLWEYHHYASFSIESILAMKSLPEQMTTYERPIKIRL